MEIENQREALRRVTERSITICVSTDVIDQAAGGLCRWAAAEGGQGGGAQRRVHCRQWNKIWISSQRPLSESAAGTVRGYQRAQWIQCAATAALAQHRQKYEWKVGHKFECVYDSLLVVSHTLPLSVCPWMYEYVLRRGASWSEWHLSIVSAAAVVSAGVRHWLAKIEAKVWVTSRQPFQNKRQS